MFNLPCIILVDNEERELNQLRDAFFNAGLPCLPLKYNTDPENTTGLDHFNKPENFRVRLMFTDLNLREPTNINATELVGPIAMLIKSLVSGGPYILIFWSPHKREADEVMNLLQERFSTTITLPLAWDTIDKTDYQMTGNTGTDVEISTRLRNRIIEAIQKDPLFAAMLDWEGRIAEASRDTFQSLYELAKPSVVPPSTYSLPSHKENLVQLMTIMAQESIGSENAKLNPAFAIDQVMLPVLEDHLSHVKDRVETNKLWRGCLPKLGDAVKPERKILARLNTFLHIDNVKNSLKKTTRGAFVEPSAAFNNEMGIYIGKTRTEILSDFLDKEIKVTGKSIERAYSAALLGFLEISADCDHAQQNVDLYKYILGALIPEEFSGFLCRKGKGRHDGVYSFPNIIHGSYCYKFQLNFRYQISTTRSSRLLGNPLFRVREQILADIVFRCSQHSARPGFIAFR